MNQEELIERVSNFAFNCLTAVRSLSRNEENRIYSKQLIRSSSSVGANYIEATCASSKKDFTNSVNIARKEAKESLYWLKLLMRANPEKKESLSDLIAEGEELVKILSAIVKTAKSN